MSVELAPATATSFAALPQVNLIPPEIAEQRRLRQLRLALGGVVLLAVVGVGALYQSGQSSVASAQQQLTSATQQDAQLQQQLGKLSNVNTVNQQVNAVKALYLNAMGDEIQWSHYLTDLSLMIPSNVWLSSIQASETSPSTGVAAAAPGATSGYGTVTFTGTAFSHDDVATWLESLAKEPGYTDPYFSNSTEQLDGPRVVVKFSSTVTLTQQALSGRAAAQVGN